MDTPRLDADALATELAKLPPLSATSSAELNTLRIAIARAVATGQDADQLARDLNTPAGWQSVDFSKPPITQPTQDKALTTAPPIATASKPPEWISVIVPIAMSKKVSSRVLVLDREPTALGGLERPAWARALAPAATYGPVTVTNHLLQTTTSKWLQFFTFVETVEFVRGSTVLCVIPLSIFDFGSSTQAAILTGSAWIAAQPFVASAPADGFAGLTIQSGELTCDQPLSFGSATVSVPATATLKLSLVPAALAAGPSGFPTQAEPPTSITATFPPSGTSSITFDQCSSTLYGQEITCEQTLLPANYNPQLKLLFIPGLASADTFEPVPVAGKLLTFSGSAPIEAAGWALSVSEAAPTALGSAANSGDFAIVFGAGISCQWTGIARSESAAGGSLVAQNNVLLLSVLSGSPPGIVIQQKFSLWDDQDTANKQRCQLVAGRVTGQLLTYALTDTSEIVEYFAVLEAFVDRPLLATGARIPANFLSGIVGLIRTGASYRLAIFSATPDPLVPPGAPPAAFPMALDNALLDVSVPAAILISAKTDATFNTAEGLALILFGYVLIELYLPDPYTGGFQVGRGQGNPLFGFLLAEVGWSDPHNVVMRFIDTASTHPATLPPSEASSDPVPPLAPLSLPVHPPPITPIHPLALETSDEALAVQPDSIIIKPPALPEPQSAFLLLDLSTRASLLGVEVTFNEKIRYSIDGLSVRGPASLLPLFTLPAIAWEPIYDTTPPDPGSPADLLHPPGDGPLTEVRPTSATLIPISPLQSLNALLNAGQGGFTAQLTLPFGLTGALDSVTSQGTVLPNLTLVQPTFPATSTPAGTLYTGAWQLSIAAPDPTQPDPILAGRSYLRNFNDDPPEPLQSYGEQVLGNNVSSVFSGRFDADASLGNAGVPLRRYDLTGYGASTFSEWTNAFPGPTAVLKAHFHVLIGRTSHEVIQIQSLIYPWAIKVVRTITIDRQGSGVVLRFDSGWQAASDGLFNFPAATGITINDLQLGPIDGLISITNIQELGLPVSATGTLDDGVLTELIALQPVTFNADVAIQHGNKVLQGGMTITDLDGNTRTCLPSTGITGFVGLTPGFHLSMLNMAEFSSLANGVGGPINGILNAATANTILRVTSFDAFAINDPPLGLGLACSLRGIPKLSSDGSWSMASRTGLQPTPVPINPSTAIPIVRPNTPGNLVHFAEPSDIFRLAPGSPTPPNTIYGFLQSTGTQSNFLSRPILTVNSPNLTLGDNLNVAHAGALLGAISGFPALASCLQFLPGSLGPILNQLENASLQTTQSLQLPPAVHAAPIRLVTCSVAHVDLYFYWSGETPTDNHIPTVVIGLGQPAPAPSWSLDINHIAVGLTIPALLSDPILELQGSFHADANTPPAFPNLDLVFNGILNPVSKFLTALSDVAGAIGSQNPSAPPPGLHLSFSDGKLDVSDNFALPSLPLGPGTIDDISLDIGATMDIVGLSIDFLLSIGTPDAPCHWIVDPLAGTFCLQLGVQNNAPDILIQAGIGAGLAIDLEIASGSASITIAVQIQVQGSPVTIELLFLLTGQAQVSVLGGLVGAALSLTAGLGLIFNPSNPLDVNLVGTAAVGIHISICWVINISWSGAWTFQKEINLKQLT